jgi:hypothetical protein
MEEMSAFLVSLERTLGASGMLPPEATRSLARLLRTMHTAGDLEPSEAWQTWLVKLFPKIVEGKAGATLDDLASTLGTMFRDEQSEA